MEQNFIMIKPDAMERGLSGVIIDRFERSGLKITAMKTAWFTKQQTAKFYPSDDAWLKMLAKKGKEIFAARGDKLDVDELEHGKLIKKWLVDYISSGPVILMIIEGENVVHTTRKLVGTTDPSLSAPGTIRGDYCSDSIYHAIKAKRACRNLVHVAGDAKEASEQIKFAFG